MCIYKVNFVNFFQFQQSFRPKFLGVAEQLHNEGFKVRDINFFPSCSLSALKSTHKREY